MLARRGRMTWGVAIVVLACGGDDRGRHDGLTFGGAQGGDFGETGDVEDATDTSGDPAGSGDGESGPAQCPGECEPSELQTQACPGSEGAEQHRVCNLDCAFGPWSECPEPSGACTPGQVQACGECMEQTCDALGEWGTCAMACSFVCLDSARNGSEICDDQAFDMPPDQPLYLVCVTDLGGVGYVAHNTGPVQEDGVPRCQGWEDMGANAWEFLDYELQMDCDAVDKAQVIDLPPGTPGKWFGVHDQPAGGGHFTEVCIATLQ